MQFISQCRVGCDNYNSLGKAPNLRQCISAHAVHSSFHFFAATLFKYSYVCVENDTFFIWILDFDANDQKGPRILDQIRSRRNSGCLDIDEAKKCIFEKPPNPFIEFLKIAIIDCARQPRAVVLLASRAL
jgi:hypothetical protein